MDELDEDALLDSALNDFDVQLQQRQQHVAAAAAAPKPQPKRVVQPVTTPLPTVITEEPDGTDDLLDAALNDYTQEHEKEQQRQQNTTPDISGDNWNESMVAITEVLQQLLGENEDVAKLAEAVKSLETCEDSEEGEKQEIEKITVAINAIQNLLKDEGASMDTSSTAANCDSAASPDSADATIDNTLEQLQALRNMLAKVESEHSADPSAVVPEDEKPTDLEGVLSNLIPPGLILPTFQKLKELYPPYFESFRDKLNETDLDRYTRQHIKVCEIFEYCTEHQTIPQDTQDINLKERKVDLENKIWKSMEEMHEYGKAPEEIMSQL